MFFKKLKVNKCELKQNILQKKNMDFGNDDIFLFSLKYDC